MSESVIHYSKKHFLLIGSITVLILILFVTSESFMSFFGKKCLFSEVTGTVLIDGKPVKGAEIERYYLWNGPDRTNRERVLSDQDGSFSFPEVYDNALMTILLPTSPSIQQEITIRHQGREYEAYLFFKNNYDKNGELNGKPLSLSCDLEDEPSNDGGFYGVCTLAG